MAQSGPRDLESVLDSRYTLTEKGMAAAGRVTARRAAVLQTLTDHCFDVESRECMCGFRPIRSDVLEHVTDHVLAAVDRCIPKES
jgi:Mn-dependent DtxR family transcriptional regulator